MKTGHLNLGPVSNSTRLDWPPLFAKAEGKGLARADIGRPARARRSG
jgi:hypothetical protein